MEFTKLMRDTSHMPKQRAAIVVGIDRLVTERVAQARQMRDLNKRELADKLGLAESSYSPYENYKIPFTVAMLERLSRILNMPIEWFLGVSCDLEADEQQMLSMYQRAKQAGMATYALGVLEALTKSLKEE